MAEENKAVDTAIEDKGADAQAEDVTLTPEQVIAENKALKAEAEKNSELLKKLRKFERENKERAEREMLETGKYKELYEQAIARSNEIEAKHKTRIADEKIKEILNQEKAKSVSTVLKLIDRSKIEFNDEGEVDVQSIANIVKSIKETDSILFDTQEAPVAPNLKRATEGDVIGGYEKELAAISHKTNNATDEIYKIMKKYNKV